MKKPKKEKAIYRFHNVKHKDNVICYVRAEVVLCR